MSKPKKKLRKKRYYDPDLLAISGSTKQYMTDVKNFVKRVLFQEVQKDEFAAPNYVYETREEYTKYSKKKSPKKKKKK